MPQIYNDALDDPLAFDGVVNFSGGEDSQADPSQLQKIQSSKLINVALNRIGDIVTRKGTEKLGSAAVAAARIQGLGELDTPSVELILAACNGSMFKNNAGTWSAAAGYTPTSATVMVEIVQGIDKLYVADGTKNLFSWDGTTFTDMLAGSTNPPASPKLLAWHTSRLFAVKDNSDYLYISKILDPTVWDPTNWALRIGGGEGDSISCLGSWSDFNLLVFKHNSMHVVNANPSVDPSEWEIRKITDRVGCVAQRSGKMVGNDFYFLARDGIRSVLRTINDAQSEVSAPISWPIQPIMDRINWSAVNTACAEYADNKYLLSVPIDGATQPNAVIAIDTRLKVPLGIWTGTGWTPTVFLFSKLSNTQNLYFGNADGKVLRWMYDEDDDLESSYEDDGSDIATTARTRSLNYEEAIFPKIGWHAEFEFNKSLANASAYAILDQEPTAQPVALNFDTFGETNQLAVNLPFDLAVLTIHRTAFDLAQFGEFREIQFEIRTTAGKLALKQILSSAYIETMKDET
jgi:hypothetical protein